MNMFDELIMSIVLLLFPLFCYLFYIVANKNVDDKHRDLALGFALISIVYFISKYPLNDFYLILLLSIPIFLTCKRRFLWLMHILFLAVIIIQYDNIYVSLIIINALLSLFINRKQDFFQYLFLFSLTSLISIIILEPGELSYYLLMIMAYIALANLVYFTITKGEEIINYHIEFKNMKKEYEIRHSLFKITHEIKNPLAVCKAYIDMFDYNNPACAKKYIPIISGEIDKLLLLLQDFLLVNKDNIQFDIMDVNVLLEDIVESMSELRRFNINLETLDDEIFISGDYNRLTQVLTNLIKNSIEANADIVTIKLSLMPKDVLIEVIDNGDGIADDIKDNIYVPFYTTKKDGTGLGVSLSKEIIEAHNGILEYESSSLGTTAKIFLPLYSL